MPKLYQIRSYCSTGSSALEGTKRLPSVTPSGARALQHAMQFLGRRAAGEKVRERPADAGNLIRRLVDELEPEMPDPRREPLGQMQARLLRFGSEDGVAAARRRPSPDAGGRRNRAARPGVSRTAGRNRDSWCRWKEIGKRRSARCGTRAGDGRRWLPGARGSTPRASAAICAAFRSCVGATRPRPIASSMSAEIALAAFRLKSPSSRTPAARSVSRSPAERTRIGRFAAQQEIGDSLFARFQNARAGDARLDPRSLHPIERRPQTVQIQVVERDAGGRERDGGIQLLRECGPEDGACVAPRRGRFRRGQQLRDRAQRIVDLHRAQPATGVRPASRPLAGATDSAASWVRRATLRSRAPS